MSELGEKVPMEAGELFECGQCGLVEQVLAGPECPWVVAVVTLDRHGHRTRSLRLLCTGCHELLVAHGALARGGGE